MEIYFTSSTGSRKSYLLKVKNIVMFNVSARIQTITTVFVQTYGGPMTISV